MQFEVITSNLGILEEKFFKLNKKCEKYGNEKLSFTILTTYDKDTTSWSTIEVSGCTPLIGTNKLIGVISQLEDGTNIIKCVPGQELPVSFRTNKFFCDHCKENRYRKEVVIVQNEQGNYVQLGKTCLKDYLGISLENLVNRFQYIYDECIEAGNQDEEYGPREELVVNPLFYLTQVSVCVRKMGYVSSQAAYNDPDITPTKSYAWDIATRPYDRIVKDLIKFKELYVEESDTTLAEQVFNWASSSTEDNDFWYNIKALLRQNVISYKNIGYIACLITMYQKHQLSLSKPKSTSEYIGDPKVKGRLTAEVTCTFMKEIESQFGFKILYKFLTKEGNLLTWFSSGKGDFRVNQEYTIKFSVKDHQEFKGEKSTMITRVKDETNAVTVSKLLQEVNNGKIN